MKTQRKNRVLEICYIAIFSAIIAVCSWITVPTNIVPFTLQTFGVFVACGMLGGKRGTVSVIIYILLGAVGAPVFAGFMGGFGHLMGATGGYIVGFIFTALTMWLFEKLFGKKTYILVLSMIVGLVVCYAFGTVWFIAVYTKTKGEMGIWSALSACVFPYLIPDGIKILLATLISTKCRKFLKLDS